MGPRVQHKALGVVCSMGARNRIQVLDRPLRRWKNVTRTPSLRKDMRPSGHALLHDGWLRTGCRPAKICQESASAIPPGPQNERHRWGPFRLKVFIKPDGSVRDTEVPRRQREFWLKAPKKSVSQWKFFSGQLRNNHGNLRGLRPSGQI